MFHFHVAQFIEVRLPSTLLRQIVGDTFTHENVAGVAAIHHSLRDVDAYACDVFAPVCILRMIQGPLCIPILTGRLGSARKARLISKAHSTGSSTEPVKTSAMPSPVGKTVSSPAASAPRATSVRPQTRSTREAL